MAESFKLAEVTTAKDRSEQINKLPSTTIEFDRKCGVELKLRVVKGYPDNITTGDTTLLKSLTESMQPLKNREDGSNTILIGRGTSSNQTLESAKAMSRNHAGIEITSNSKVLLTDLGSTNGTVFEFNTILGKQQFRKENNAQLYPRNIAGIPLKVDDKGNVTEYLLIEVVEKKEVIAREALNNSKRELMEELKKNLLQEETLKDFIDSMIAVNSDTNTKWPLVKQHLEQVFETRDWVDNEDKTYYGFAGIGHRSKQNVLTYGNGITLEQLKQEMAKIQDPPKDEIDYLIQSLDILDQHNKKEKISFLN